MKPYFASKVISFFDKHSSEHPENSQPGIPVLLCYQDTNFY